MNDYKLTITSDDLRSYRKSLIKMALRYRARSQDEGFSHDLRFIYKMQLSVIRQSLKSLRFWTHRVR